MAMIDVQNLTKKFDDFTAVDDLTFKVDRGEVFGLLGPNGAGKTTTVRMLCCLIAATDGSADVAGHSIADKDEAMKIRKIIGIVHDSVGLYDSLSAYENLEFFGRMYEASESLTRQNIEKYLKMLDLWDKRNQKVGEFSKGMKQKVAVARALVHEPEILFMDEPTANLDPEASKIIRDVILELRGEGRTIFLNTHNLDEAQRICNRIGVLRTKLIAVDTPQNLELAVSQKRTTFVMESVNDKILQLVRSRNPGKTEVVGNSIVVELKEPEKDTPELVSLIAAAGGKIRSVNETGATLEEVYLKLVRE